MNASIDTARPQRPGARDSPPTQPVGGDAGLPRRSPAAGQLEREIVQANLGADGAASAAAREAIAMPPLSARQRAGLTVALSLAVFMNVLDLGDRECSRFPQLAGDLGTSADQGTWVITSFRGERGDRHAAHRLASAALRARCAVFLVCTAMFTVASLACGLSSNLAMLIAMRTIQGVFGGPMIPLSQSLLLKQLSRRPQEPRARVAHDVTIVAPVLGPILGGWITDNWNWAWIFYINVPGRESSPRCSPPALLRGRETATARVPADVVGIALLALASAACRSCSTAARTSTGSAPARSSRWPPFALVALAFFVAWELTEEQPAVGPLALRAAQLHRRAHWRCAWVSAPTSANIVLLPLWLQTRWVYTATWAGLASAPVGLLPIALVALIARLLEQHRPALDHDGEPVRVRARVHFWFAGFNTAVTFSMLAWSRFAQGVGLALFFVPLMSIVLSGLPPGRVASASGLANTLRTLAGQLRHFAHLRLGGTGASASSGRT